MTTHDKTRSGLGRLRNWLTGRGRPARLASPFDMTIYQIDDLGLSAGDITEALRSGEAPARFRSPRKGP